MPKPRTRVRWEVPGFPEAYIIDRGGFANGVIRGNNPFSLGKLEFIPKNKKLAVERMKQKLFEMYDNKYLAKNIDLQTAIAEFLNYKKDRVKKHTFSSYTYAFKKMIKKNFKVSEWELIRSHIKINVNEMKRLGYKNLSINRYLAQLSTFFEYCVELDYMLKNPINKLIYVAQEEPSKITHTDESSEILINYFLNADSTQLQRDYGLKRVYHLLVERHILFGHMLRFLKLTGVRINEALNIWVNPENAPEIKPGVKSLLLMPERIIIDGKAKQQLSNIREIPIPIIPGLKENLENILQLQHLSPDGKLFPWTTYKSLYAVYLTPALIANDLDNLIGFHSFRRYTTNWLEKKEGGLPLRVVEFIMGHKDEARRKHYEHYPKAEELINMVNSESKHQSSMNDSCTIHKLNKGA
jgi:integrase